MSEDNGVLNLPVDFPSEQKAVEFVRLYVDTFNWPCMRIAKRVHLIMKRNDFERAMGLACDHGGTLIYGVDS